MVDPKRHINILSPEEQSFLEECESEFANRFTDEDEEFKAHCQRQSKPPPIVHPWNIRRGGGGGWRRHGVRNFADGRCRGRRPDYDRSQNSSYQYIHNRGYGRNRYRSGGNNSGDRDKTAPYSHYSSHYRSGDGHYDREDNR